MKPFCLRHLRLAVGAILFAGILLFRFIPGAGEVYARTFYPVISSVLSAVASTVPVLLEEVLVIGAGAGLLIYPFAARRHGWKHIVFREAEIIAWIYIWFYWGWGMNYFRDDFYQRANVTPVAYHEEDFRRFLHTYTEKLNKAYVALPSSFEVRTAEEEIKEIYRTLPAHFGLAEPRSFQHPKRSLIDGLYSSVGVLGYMGPFFAESYINKCMKADAFTYAHELSHWLGVSSEAEANFWAYQVCLRSSDAAIRYQGYFGLLPYVLTNANSLLSQHEFEAWVQTLLPEITADYRKLRQLRARLYSPLVGSIQDTVYDWYLKSNRISSGQKNYAEVIGMILSVQEEWRY